MSFHETNLLSVTKKQFIYKLQANLGILISLMIIQLLALLLSTAGVSSMSVGTNLTIINLKIISGDIIIVFTLIWAFIVGYNTAGNAYRLDYHFVTNRLSSNLASGCFLLLTSLLAGITATFCGVLLRVLLYFWRDLLTTKGLSMAPALLMKGSYVTVLYACLLSALGYFYGMLAQRNKALTVLIPVLFFGSLFAAAKDTRAAQLFRQELVFYFSESSLALFTLKIVLTVALLFITIILFTNRLEVRK